MKLLEQQNKLRHITKLKWHLANLCINLKLGVSSPWAIISVVPLKAAEKTADEVLRSMLGDCCFVSVPSPHMDTICTPESGPSDLFVETSHYFIYTYNAD